MIATATVDQVNVAIEAADAIIFVVNVQEGIVPLDLEVAQHLRQSGKPTLLAVNKSDNNLLAENAVEFSQLGFDQIFPVSALHDRGTDSMMLEGLSHLPQKTPSTEESSSAAEPLKLAFVGRPNVGKSSIINALTQSDRVIVSDIPGTTRDAVDVPFTIETDGRQQECLLIDTAGAQKSGQRHARIFQCYPHSRRHRALRYCRVGD